MTRNCTLRVQKLPVTAYFVCRNIITTLDCDAIKETRNWRCA